MQKKKGKHIARMWVLLMINVLLITAAQVSGSFLMIAAAIGLYLITVLTADESMVFPLMLFFLPWSTILKMSPTSMSFYSVATVMLFFKCLIKRPKFNRVLIVSCLGVGIVTIISKALHSYMISATYLMFVGMMIAFPFIYLFVKDSVDFEDCVKFYVIGIMSATVVSLVFGSYPNMIRYVNVMEQSNLGVTRLCGFYADPNFYSAQIVTAFGAPLMLLTVKKTKKLLEFCLILGLVLCGTISLSKSFLISIVIILFLWLFSVFCHRPTKAMAGGLLLALIALAALASGAMDDVIRQYTVRFDMATDASSLTTGRTDLWLEYLDFTINHPMELIFGQGYTNVFNGVSKGSHSTPIQLIYQLGILGSIMFLTWLHSFKLDAKIGKFGMFGACWIVSCFIMWIGLDFMFFDDMFIAITLCALGFNYLEKQTENR